MARRKEVIGKDGQLKTVVRRNRSRAERIDQHMHGRSDHIRMDDDWVKYTIYTCVSVAGIGLIVLFIWLAISQ